MPLPIIKSEEATTLLSHIRKRYHSSTRNDNGEVIYSPEEFENDIQRWLNLRFPFSALPGVRVYSPQKRLQYEFGVEVDHIIHFQHGPYEYILIIEAKKQLVSKDGGAWKVQYGDRIKCAKKQVLNQIETIKEYLEPITGNVDVRYIGIVVSADDETETDDDLSNSAKGELYLRPIKRLYELLRERLNLQCKDSSHIPKRYTVSQSQYLDLLRMSIPIDHLGHPEIEVAVQYVRRCRRSLDETLFKEFNPKKER